MIRLDLKQRVVKYIKTLPPKHQRQIKNYILSLQKEAFPHDVKSLNGYENYVRADVGEYRIIYRHENKKISQQLF